MLSQIVRPKRSAADPDGFRSLIREEICSMQYDTEVAVVARPASLVGVRTGGVDVLHYKGEGVQRGRRDREHISVDRADYYVICSPVAAQLSLRQNGVDVSLHPGTFAIVSTCRPFEASIRPLGNGQSFSALHVRVPGSLLRPRIPNVDDICGHGMEICRGSGSMMLSLFDIALNDGPHLSEDERTEVGGMLLNAIGNAALPVCESVANQKDQQTAHRRILNRAKAYIAAHLSDADLTPSQIARHCGISARYLHAAFASLSHDTVASFVRESRLQASRSALKSPLLGKRPIIQIAGDWGFDDPSHFCHVYKSRFGRTPREERYRASLESA